MTPGRKKRGSGFNVRVVVWGGETVSELASVFEVYPSQVPSWRKALCMNGPPLSSLTTPIPMPDPVANTKILSPYRGGD